MWIMRLGVVLIYGLMGSRHTDRSPAPCHYSKAERPSHLPGQWGSTAPQSRQVSEMKEAPFIYDLFPVLKEHLCDQDSISLLSASLPQKWYLSQHWLPVRIMPIAANTAVAEFTYERYDYAEVQRWMRGRDGSETRLQRLRVERGNTGEQSDWYQQHKRGLDPFQLEWKSNPCQLCCPQRLILFANKRRLAEAFQATVAQKIPKLTLKKLTWANCTGENDREPNDLTPVVVKVSLRFGPASPYVRWWYTIRVCCVHSFLMSL